MRLISVKDPELYLDCEDTFIEWFREKSGIIIIDPYQDKVLYEEEQINILSAIKEAQNTFRECIVNDFISKNKLPRDEKICEEILNNIVGNLIKRDEFWEVLHDLKAFLELMIIFQSAIFCYGD